MVEIVISVTNVLAQNYCKNHHVSFIYLLFFAGRLFMYKRLFFFADNSPVSNSPKPLVKNTKDASVQG